MSDVKEQEKTEEEGPKQETPKEVGPSEPASTTPPDGVVKPAELLPDTASEGAEPAPEPASAPGVASAEPKKKKKKKKKKVEGDGVTEEVGEEGARTNVFERPALDAEGRERPRFLLRFPEDSDLEALIQAFEAGNFRAVRDGAPRLVERTDRPEVKRAAEELLRRIEPDPLVKFLLGVAVFLFVAIVTYVYYSHG